MILNRLNCKDDIRGREGRSVMPNDVRTQVKRIRFLIRAELIPEGEIGYQLLPFAIPHETRKNQPREIAIRVIHRRKKRIHQLRRTDHRFGVSAANRRHPHAITDDGGESEPPGSDHREKNTQTNERSFSVGQELRHVSQLTPTRPVAAVNAAQEL